MDVRETIIMLCFFALQMAIRVFYFNQLAVPKVHGYSSFAAFLMVTIPCIFYNFVCFDAVYLKFTIDFFISILAVVLNYHGNLIYKIIISIVGSFCMLLCELFLDIIVMFIFKYNPTTSITFNILFMSQFIALPAFTLISICAIKLISKKKHFVISQYDKFSLFSLLTQAAVTIGITNEVMNPNNAFSFSFLILLIFNIIISGFCIRHWVKQSFIHRKYQQQTKLLFIEYEQQLAIYENMKIDEKELRYLRHDLMNYMNSLKYEGDE